MLPYLNYSGIAFPPQVIFAKGPVDQQSGGRPQKASVKKAAKKAANKGSKKK